MLHSFLRFSEIIKNAHTPMQLNGKPSHHVFTALQCILHVLTVLWGELVCYTRVCVWTSIPGGEWAADAFKLSKRGFIGQHQVISSVYIH